MTLKELYCEEGKKPMPLTPKEIWVQKVAKLTGRRTTTVLKWIYGVRRPDKASAILLQKHFKTNINELIPNYNDKL